LFLYFEAVPCQVGLSFLIATALSRFFVVISFSNTVRFEPETTKDRYTSFCLAAYDQKQRAIESGRNEGRPEYGQGQSSKVIEATMPTLLTHPAVPLAMALGLGHGIVSRRLLFTGIVVSVLPDLDVVAFRLGIPYGADFGHRGFSHSVLFAFMAALAGASLFRSFRSTFLQSFSFLFIAALSHGALDALTNGGLGIAFLWPWSGERFFSPIQVIEVAPLRLSRFLSLKGAAVLRSEFLWVWLPVLGMAFTGALLRLTLTRQRSNESVRKTALDG